MPRSGTTLVEQIMLLTQEVYGAGELSFLTNVIHDNFFNEDNLINKKLLKIKILKKFN